MKTIQLVNEAHIFAIKSKDVVGKALFSTLKGEIENLKSTKEWSGKPESQLIEHLAKKFTENAKIVASSDSILEIELLKPFLPESLPTSRYSEIAFEVVESNVEKVKEIKAGNNSAIGFLVGTFMKVCKSNYPSASVDASMVKEALNVTIQKYIIR